MRKMRDYDSELKALQDRAEQLQKRKLVQLGELVIACKADALPIEDLAGALLAAAETKDGAVRKAWHERGAAFFSATPRSAGDAAQTDQGSTARERGGASSQREDRA